VGYYTYFTGRLDFARPLNKAEFGWIVEIIEAGNSRNAEVEGVIEREREQRRDPAGPLIYRCDEEHSRRLELLGLISPKGAPGFIDYDITEDGRGLEYAETEKSYTMIEGLNFIIANARRKIPDFALRGEMRADTEFAPYSWLIRMGADGWAEQVPIRSDLPKPLSRLRNLLKLGR